MTTISERLREQVPIGTPITVCRTMDEAADTIDALVAVLEDLGETDSDDFNIRVRAALAKAKSCHTGNSARGNAMKDEA